MFSSNSSKVRKTREELLADFENELVRFEAMSIKIDGHEQPLVFSRDMDPMPQRLHFMIPEYSTYYLSIRYKVLKRPLQTLTYHQTVKKSGIIVDSRDLHMIEDAKINDGAEGGDYHEITFPPGGVPGGTFLRGDYPAKSTIKEKGEKIWSYKWTLEIIKKTESPAVGGFD